MDQQADTGLQYWTAKRVQEITGYSRVTLWRKSRDPEDDFPAPRQLSANRIARDSKSVLRWMSNRPIVPRGAEKAGSAA